MQSTSAKSLVREFFYHDFLPAQLPAKLLRSGNYLVLLGEGHEERELLAQLNVPGFRIYSVENDPKVFTQQSRRANNGELDAVLYYGELTEFIRHHLHSNQRFLVLNLDICGSYLNSIDSQPSNRHRADSGRKPAMMPILLFARRNPRTVIATYSNVGRDGAQLREGLKSLAICRWLSPEATAEFADEVYGRYLSAGVGPDVSLNMILRHFFWLRSHLEHIVLGAVALKTARPDSASRLFQAFDQCWEATKVRSSTPIKYGEWLGAVDSLRRPPKFARMLDLGLQTATIATYEAAHSFYHTGWFSVYARFAPMAPGVWLEQALSMLTDQPLRYAGRDGTQLGSFQEATEPIPRDMVVWSRKGLDHPGRRLEMPMIPQEVRTLGRPSFVEATQNGSRTAKAWPEEDVIEFIRRLARKDPSLNTEQIIERLPQPVSMPRTRVTAYISAARTQRR